MLAVILSNKANQTKSLDVKKNIPIHENDPKQQKKRRNLILFPIKSAIEDKTGDKTITKKKAIANEKLNADSGNNPQNLIG